MLGTGLGIYGLGLIATIAQPSIITAVDGGDQDSAVLTVTGQADATIRSYYRLRTDTDWTTGPTRTGSGDITITGLTAGQWYEFYIDQFVGETFSEPSQIVSVYIAQTDEDNIESALFALVTGDVNVDAIIGDAMYPQIIPQGDALPAVTYSEISGNRLQVTAGPVGLVESRWQMNCWAEHKIDARQLSDAVRQSIDGFDGFVGNVEIQSIQCTGEVDLGDHPAGVDVSRRYGLALEFEIWFAESP
jgi:hypothetical protein